MVKWLICYVNELTIHKIIKMKITNLLAIVVMVLLASCASQKKISKVTITPPEGIEFNSVENFKGFARIDLPKAGLGFVENRSVSVPKNQTDAGVFVPGVSYEDNHLIIWSTIGDQEGDLDAQYALFEKRFIKGYMKESSELTRETKTIDKKEVVFVRLLTPMNNGNFKYTYGYIVPHHNKAALFLINDALVVPKAGALYDSTIEKAFNYMIRTVEFQD